MPTFHTTIKQTGKNTAGIQVPPEVVESLGAGKRPAVRVTLNGYTYRNTIAVMGGLYMLGVSAEHRAGAGVAAGDVLDVEVELDTAPREVSVPPDLQAALDKDSAAKKFFEGLSYSQKSWFAQWIESARKEETRQKRLGEAVTMLREGRAR